MVLGFKDRFEPMVLDGSKGHTIRAGFRWKAGMRADLFVRARQKDMRLLFRAPVVRVEEISIWMRSAAILGETIPGERVYCGPLGISIAGEVLTDDEANLLAWNDGFRSGRPVRRDGPLDSLIEMFGFWKPTHGLDLTFHGQIIYWDYSRRMLA